MKGGNGQTCKEVCEALGRTCNNDWPSILVTDDLVASAFFAAGYSCKSFHRRTNIAGAPFSTGRDSDDCAPITPDAKSSCSENLYSHHAALCYCDIGNQN